MAAASLLRPRSSSARAADTRARLIIESPRAAVAPVDALYAVAVATAEAAREIAICSISSEVMAAELGSTGAPHMNSPMMV